MNVPQENGSSNDPKGNPSPNGGNGGEANNLTEQSVNELVNRAITARFKTFESKIEKSLGDMTGGFTGKFDEFSKQFEALKPKEEPKPPKGKEPAAPAVEESEAFKAMQKAQADLQRKLDLAEKKASDAEAKRRDANLRSTTDDALVRAGIDPKAVKLARGHLVDAEKRIRYAEDGETLVYVSGDEELSLSDGLKQWAKGDEAKFFLPPRGTAGSGDRGGGSAPRAPDGQITRENLGQMLMQVL